MRNPTRPTLLNITMLTYAQFHRNLVEKLLKGFEDMSYCEIYQNPTPDELTEAGHKQPPNWGLEKIGSQCYYMGGILTAKDLYVFNRNHSEHKVVSHQIPNLGRDWLPLYLYYFPAENVLALSLSSFSLSPKMSIGLRDGQNHLRRAIGHRAFRKFELVNDEGLPLK